MEAFMKLVGSKYLMDTLRQVITKVVEASLECEVRKCNTYLLLSCVCVQQHTL